MLVLRLQQQLYQLMLIQLVLQKLQLMQLQLVLALHRHLLKMIVTKLRKLTVRYQQLLPLQRDLMRLVVV